jgi:hypothetical protein
MSFPNRRHRNVLAAVLLLFPSALQAGPPAKGGEAPQGKLDIRLLVTTEPEKVFRPRQGPDGKLTHAEPVKVVPKGQIVAAVVFFKDCQPDATGKCNVDLDLKGVDPHGVTFQDRKGLDLWHKPAPHSGIIQLGTAFMKIQFEAKDPAGTYRVIAVGHDRISGIDSRSETSFAVK